jgi:hypothetical protein
MSKDEGDPLLGPRLRSEEAGLLRNGAVDEHFLRTILVCRGQSSDSSGIGTVMNFASQLADV